MGPSQELQAQWSRHRKDVLPRTRVYRVIQVYCTDNHGWSEGMMEQYEFCVSKFEFIFNGDWNQCMVHYCPGFHSQTMEGRQEIIGTGSAAID